MTTPRKGQTWLADEISVEIQTNMQRSVSLASIGLFLDLYILALPMIGVRTFNLSPKRKFGVMIAFLLGLMQVAPCPNSYNLFISLEPVYAPLAASTIEFNSSINLT